MLSSKPYLLFCFLFILGLSGISQENKTAEYAPGELLIQLRSDQDLKQLLAQYKSINLQEMEVISARFHMYRLSFDLNQISHPAILQSLHEQAPVLNVQNNHYLSSREADELIPDDPLFPDLWAFKNTGQEGGVAGADIGATEAWDITTGGLTIFGDTIVVAIVDGGSFLSHEDLSHWKNRHEIPGNGVDDDGNGYVDDVNGWNAYTNNGSIPAHAHGVHVAGITGAIGNNGIGVTGLNWTLKVLPVVGDAGIESIVVKALDYVYTIRHQYDETNGQKGAFIVADNCSFGKDQGNPNDYPIWEAMYDSLGQLGILSMAATANKAWDIDEVGDVPTGFTTDYMIAVTNSTNRDELYTSAGWGDTAIDLSAPGTRIKSCLTSNTYGNKTGTSMATPMLTGAMALLMAAADSVFMTYYNEDPAAAALLMKYHILNNVDLLPDLEGKTVSGGRLNVFKAMNSLLQDPLYTTEISKPRPQFVRAYPNPFKDQLTFEVILNDAQTADFEMFELFDEYGRLISSEKIGLSLGKNSFTTDYSDLPKGIYIYKFSFNGKPSTVGKLVKW